MCVSSMPCCLGVGFRETDSRNVLIFTCSSCLVHSSGNPTVCIFIVVCEKCEILKVIVT